MLSNRMEDSEVYMRCQMKKSRKSPEVIEKISNCKMGTSGRSKSKNEKYRKNKLWSFIYGYEYSARMFKFCQQVQRSKNGTEVKKDFEAINPKLNDYLQIFIKCETVTVHHLESHTHIVQ